MRPALVLLIAAGATLAPAGQDNFSKKLSKDDQIRHAVERLTFGARPGDLETVRRQGLKKWIDAQLHPERIAENPELEARLKPLESLRMTQAEAARSYPAPQMILAFAQGRQPLPEDPVLRAAVERLARKYKLRKKTDNAATTEADMEPVKSVEDLLEPAQVKTLRSGKPEEKSKLLNSLEPEKLDDLLIAMDRPMRQQVFNNVPEETRRKIMLLNAPAQVISYDLNEGKLYRAIYSNRQLEELLVDFWYNHFNVYLDKGSDRFLVPTYEREAIRPHVLGKFRELLEATAHSPAMLFYLDNWQSVAPQPASGRAPKRNARGLNENYARELLELHSLGVDGGYTQKDIIEVARCFTGWTIKNPQQGGEFTFNEKSHDQGEKVVLGVKIAAGGGESDGEKVLDILAQHPSTARFISRKLAIRFVADEPPAALLNRMAATFTKTGGDLRAVMKTMLESREFASAGAYRSKVKTPFEMVVSAVRALNAEVDSAFPLSNQLATLGMPLYRKMEPTGYSSTNSEWVNSGALLARMNFALALAQNRITGVKVDANKFAAPRISVQTQGAIEQTLKDKKPTPALNAGLILGSPEFQRR